MKSRKSNLLTKNVYVDEKTPTKRKSKLLTNDIGQKSINWGEYVVGKLGTGALGVVEGTADLLAGTAALLGGNKEYAEYLFMHDNWVSDLNAKLDEGYNPGKVMRFVGDTASGLGQSTTFLIPGVGQVMFFTGVMGNGISSASQKTGKVGFKEYGYGALSAALEFILERFVSGSGQTLETITKTGAKNIGSALTKAVGKTAAKNTARKMVATQLISTAVGEGVEEFFGNVGDHFLQNITGVDRESEFDFGAALYDFAVGMASGGLMGGVSTTVQTAYEQKNGAQINADEGRRERMLKQARGLVESAKKQNLDKGSDAVATYLSMLEAGLNTYDGAKGKSGAMAEGAVNLALGKINSALMSTEFNIITDRHAEHIASLSEAERSELAAYANDYFRDAGANVTAEDLRDINNEYTRALATLDWAGNVVRTMVGVNGRVNTEIAEVMQREMLAEDEAVAAKEKAAQREGFQKLRTEAEKRAVAIGESEKWRGGEAVYSYSLDGVSGYLKLIKEADGYKAVTISEKRADEVKLTEEEVKKFLAALRESQTAQKSNTESKAAEGEEIPAVTEEAAEGAKMTDESGDSRKTKLSLGQNDSEATATPKKRKKITRDMSEQERYELLKDRTIPLTAKADMQKLSTLEAEHKSKIDNLIALTLKEKKALFKKIGEEFSIFTKYVNADVELEFELSRGGLDESTQKQMKNYLDYVKMLTCIDQVIENAVGIEVHNRNDEGYKVDPTLEDSYVLISVFESDDIVIPVKLEIKKFTDKENKLYVAITLDGIKKEEIVTQGDTVNGVTQDAPSSIVSIAQLFKKINPSEERFLKYVPKQFFDETVSTADNTTKSSIGDDSVLPRERTGSEKAAETYEEKDFTATPQEVKAAMKAVKVYKLLSADRRQAIIEMMRSAGGIDKVTVASIANIMSARDGLHVRFMKGHRAEGSHDVLKSGERLILLNPEKTEGKYWRRDILFHELWHDLSRDGGTKLLTEEIYRRSAPAFQRMVVDRYTKYYNGVSMSQYLDGKKWTEENMKAYFDTYTKISYDEVMEEVAAGTAGRVMGSKNFIKNFRDVSILRRIFYGISDFCRAMVNKTYMTNGEETAGFMLSFKEALTFRRLYELAYTKERFHLDEGVLRAMEEIFMERDEGDSERARTKKSFSLYEAYTEKYKKLDLNQDISTLDGVPAIRLMDGSILPFTEPHVTFIQNNGIDVEDIESGGWISGGVYEASERSDTMRYKERMLAKKRMDEKRAAKTKMSLSLDGEYAGSVEIPASEIEAGKKIADFIVEVNQMQDKNKVPKRKHKVGDLSTHHVSLINSIMQTVNPSFDAKGYELWIDGTAAVHIEERHGENGNQDHTMAGRDAKIIISYTAQNADEAVFLYHNGEIKKSERFDNYDQSPAPEIMLKTELSDSIAYVTECVPDSQNKIIWITSAYRQIKNGSKGQLLSIEDETSLQLTPEAVDDGDTTKNSIPHSTPKVNSKKSLSLDSDYMDAVKRGDMVTAQRMVISAAKAAGYTNDSSYQGSLAFNGAAPSANAYFETKEERKEAFDNGEFEGDYSLGDFVDTGLDNNDLEWQLNNHIAASGRDPATLASLRNLTNTVKQKKRTIKMYRAVDSKIEEGSFRNGDWITPSRQYAEKHIELQDWESGRIIEQEVSIDHIWWNGDDINEWGYDNGNRNEVYKNTKNNIKLAAITYDDDGNVIPLSERFDTTKSDIRYSLSLDADYMEADKYVSAYRIIPVNEVTDPEKLAYLVNEFEENDWQGRPILVVDLGNEYQALTGSHRLAAAMKTRMDVPIHILESDSDDVIQEILDARDDDERLRILHQYSDQVDAESIRLLEVEDESNMEQWEDPQSYQKPRYSLSLDADIPSLSAAEVEENANRVSWGFSWTDEKLLSNIRKVQKYFRERYPDHMVEFELDNKKKRVVIVAIRPMREARMSKGFAVPLAENDAYHEELTALFRSIGISDDRISEHISVFETEEEKNETIKRAKKKNEGRRLKVYQKQEVAKSLEGVLSNVLSPIVGPSKLMGKKKRALITRLWQELNRAKASEREKLAERFAEELIVSTVYDDYEVNAEYEQMLVDGTVESFEMLNEYRKKLDVSAVIEDAKVSVGTGKANVLRKRWGADKDGISPRQAFDELQAQGFLVDLEATNNEADILIAINEEYERLKERTSMRRELLPLAAMSEERLSSIKNELKTSLLTFFSEGGKDTKYGKLARRYQELLAMKDQKMSEELQSIEKKLTDAFAARVEKLREETAKSREYWQKRASEARYDREYAREQNRVLADVRGLRDYLNRDYTAASEGEDRMTRNIAKAILKATGKIGVRADKAKIAAKIMLDWVNTVKQSNPDMVGNSYLSASLTQEEYDALVKVSSTNAQEGDSLTLEELQAFHRIVNAAKRIYHRYDKVWINGKWVNVEEVAREAVSIIEGSYTEAKGIKGKLRDFIARATKTFLDPLAVAAHIDGYRTDGVITRLVTELALAEARKNRMIIELRKPFEDFFKQHKKYAKTLAEKKIKLTDEFEITLGQAITLHEMFKRDQAKAGLMLSRIGFHMDDGTIKKLEGYGQSHFVTTPSGEKVSLERAKEILRDWRQNADAGNVILKELGYDISWNHGAAAAQEFSKAIELADSDAMKFMDQFGDQRKRLIEGLEKDFTDEDREFLKVVSHFFQETSKNAKKKADLQNIGYSNVIEGYYFPIKRMQGDMAKNIADGQVFAEFATTSNISFNQSTVEGAKASVEIFGIWDVVTDHINGLAMWEHLYLPVQNINKVWNKNVGKGTGNVVSVKNLLDGRGDGDFTKWMSDLLLDVQGARQKETKTWLDTALEKLRGGYAVFQLGANVQTIAKQTLSWVAATQYIDPLYMAQGVKNLRLNADKLNTYSAVAAERENDATVVRAFSNTEKVTKLAEKTMIGITAADRVVNMAIWSACQKQVAAENPSMPTGSEENLKRAGKLCDEVIMKVQDSSDMTTKSQAARSSSEFIKSLTMFQSAGLKMFSRLWEGVWRVTRYQKLAKSDAAYQKEFAAAKKQLVRTVGAFAGVSVGTAVIVQLFKVLFNKEREDKEGNEISVLEDMALDTFGEAVGVIPVIGDLTDYFLNGYELSSYSYDMLNEMLTATKENMALLDKLVHGEVIEEWEIGRMIRKTTRSAGMMTGIPIRNVENFVTGLIRRFSKETGYAYDTLFYNANYTEDLNRAIAKGEDEFAQAILELMMKRDKTGSRVYSDEVLNTITTLHGEDYSVLPRTIDTDEVKTRKRLKAFEAVYQKADNAVEKLVLSEEFKALAAYNTEEGSGQALAIKTLYTGYYQLAEHDVLGKELTRSAAYMTVTDPVNLMLVKAYDKAIKLEAVEMTGTRKAMLAAYMKTLGMNNTERAYAAYACGFRTDDVTSKILKDLKGRENEEELLIALGLKEKEEEEKEDAA